jgi:hypothetical protein
MKKLVLLVVVAVLAIVNVNLVFNSEKLVIDLSLASIQALAQGESNICSICGYDVNICNCDDYGITCDAGSCSGKVCHNNTNNWACRCEANGNPYSFCA